MNGVAPTWRVATPHNGTVVRVQRVNADLFLMEVQSGGVFMRVLLGTDEVAHLFSGETPEPSQAAA